MRILRLSPKAKSDLDLIWSYTVERWGEEQAEIYLRSLDHAMTLLRENPMLGTDAGFIKKGCRKFPVASYLLFYRSTPKTLEVIRILHKSMDVEQHLRS